MKMANLLPHLKKKLLLFPFTLCLSKSSYTKEYGESFAGPFCPKKDHACMRLQVVLTPAITPPCLLILVSHHKLCCEDIEDLFVFLDFISTHRSQLVYLYHVLFVTIYKYICY
jgi:hypothetical protein